MSVHLPLGRIEPKAACSCRSRTYQQPDLYACVYVSACVRALMDHAAHELKLLVNSCQVFALHKGQCDENKNECYREDFLEGSFVHF